MLFPSTSGTGGEQMFTRRGEVIAFAFEIQWSTQTLQVTRDRHTAYGTDVKCCWLFKQLPSLNEVSMNGRLLPNETCRCSVCRAQIPGSMSQ